ncbi:hypothetical protein PG993_000707 [Apiospora rasikravindrae]|uniref:Uncharacterized protein n=1 Tax=Apiospora rasikravindrae TaxID=990691 RepID=A0ABR1U9B2_9PEZI
MEMNGNGEALHDPELAELQVIVQPPSIVVWGEVFNRPLVVLGPLDAAYYVVSAFNPETERTGTLSKTSDLSESEPSLDNSLSSGHEDDPDDNNDYSDFRVQPEALQVGVRATPFPNGYDMPHEEYYQHEEERHGYGYAIWDDLSITSLGSGWRLWIRAMDADGNPIGSVKTNAMLVQSIYLINAIQQTHTFAFDEMQWLQRFQRKKHGC